MRNQVDVPSVSITACLSFLVLLRKWLTTALAQQPKQKVVVPSLSRV